MGFRVALLWLASRFHIVFSIPCKVVSVSDQFPSRGKIGLEASNPLKMLLINLANYRQVLRFCTDCNLKGRSYWGCGGLPSPKNLARWLVGRTSLVLVDVV